MTEVPSEVQDNFLELIRNRSRDGEIACASVLEISKQTGFPSKQAGLLLKEHDIRIVHCQLGCFP